MTRALLAALVVLLFGSPAFPLEPIPDKLVVLTFDDSAKSHITVARPSRRQAAGSVRLIAVCGEIRQGSAKIEPGARGSVAVPRPVGQRAAPGVAAALEREDFLLLSMVGRVLPRTRLPGPRPSISPATDQRGAGTLPSGRPSNRRTQAGPGSARSPCRRPDAPRTPWGCGAPARCRRGGRRASPAAAAQTCTVPCRPRHTGGVACWLPGPASIVFAGRTPACAGWR